MLTLRMTCTLTLTVVTVACALFPACLAKEPPWAGDDDSGAAASSSGSPSSSNGGASSSSGTGSSSGKPGTSSGSSSGRSSSGGSGSSSSGGGSSSGISSSSGTSSSSGITCDPDGGQVPTNVMFDSSGNPTCVGTSGCALKSGNACCVDTGGLIPKYSCIPSSQQCSNASQSARFECVQKSDCPGNEVCCLQADQTAMTAGSKCLDVSLTGGKCTPVVTATAGSAQLCQTDRECLSGCCIWQDCTVMGNPLHFTMCGLQTTPVFSCTKH